VPPPLFVDTCVWPTYPPPPSKVAAFLASPAHATQPSLADCYGVDQIRGSRLPLIQIPTTAGTGSEVTPISILTTGASTKMGIVSSLLLPDYAVLDGSLTVSVPQMTTAHTGIDAVSSALIAAHEPVVLRESFANSAV